MTDAAARAVHAALRNFAGDVPLRAAAAQLFEALGYGSPLTAEVGSVAEFRELYAPAGKITEKQRISFDSWRAVEILFQIADEQIRRQSVLFEGAGFEAGRIESFLFLAVELNDGVYTRGWLAETVRAVNRCFAMPVVLLFRHGETVTLGVVHRRAHKRDGARDVLERVTLVKDIRIEAPHRAHVELLADLALPRMVAAGVRDFDGLHAEWERVLDIEALNRRFFGELFEWFRRAVAQCRFPDDGAGEGSAERHVIRLITRLLFIWFMKEKGLAPEELFGAAFAEAALRNHAPGRTDYYRAVLQNLFFATLNTEIDKRAFSGRNPGSHRDPTKYRYRDLLTDPDRFVEELKRVPFVNGGLFDCQDDFEAARKGGKRIDVFTDNEKHRRELEAPARLFLDPKDGLFPLLRRYKFTVEENTPLDREVALDPELLGRVFENLLAVYNPETRETARKATGSYYTPRQVVDYMVHEALTEALCAKCAPADGDAGWLRERLSYLLDHSDAMGDAGELFEDEAEKRAVVAAIAGLRALDPAVGSGAFPMGVLQTLTLGLRRLDPDNALWEAFQIERATERAGEAFETLGQKRRDDALREISATFEKYRSSDFGRKLYLIQNSIYGVDIQPVACQIVKLRFFISLTIEQKPDPGAPNLGIKPLPNLETRFVAADTLIGLDEAGAQGVLGSDAVAAIQDELRQVRERHFNARTRRAKLKLRADDETLREMLADELEKQGYGHAAAEAVARWDPYDHNAGAGWFDPEWMFGVSGGFDVAIGNPPYVRADFPGERHKATRKAVLASGRYETLWYKWDMFLPFMERSFKLLATGGVTSLIVSDAFGNAKYALKAREWFLRNARIERIDFYSGIKIFDAAVHNLSYLFQRADGAANEPLRRLHDPAFGDVTDLSSGEQKNLDERAFFPVDSYRAPAVPTIPLGELCWVSVGMTVHADEKRAPGAFTLNDVVRDARDDEHYKPFVEGKHLDRWLPRRIRWLEWDTERAPALFRSKTFPELYSVGEKIMVQRSPGPDPKSCYDDKRTHYDTSSVGFIPWHSLRGVRNRSIANRARYPDEKGRENFAKREDLESKSCRFAIKYLLGVMNSSSAQDFLRAHRRSNIHLYPDDWKALPIPDVPPADQTPIVTLVDSILAARRANPNADVSAIERELDTRVATLYGN